MIRGNPRASLALLFALLLAAACASPNSEGTTAQLEPVAPEDPLPTGHPPVANSAPMPIQPPPGSGQAGAALAWADPEGWQSVPPSSRMRRAQYRVPGEAGDAEFVAFYFGPGEGGDARANVIRWADQFGQADGRSSRDVLVTEEMDIGGIAVLLAEVTGIYSGGMAGIGGTREVLPGYMLLGAIAEGPDANWFFKFTGPEATVRDNRDKFMGVIQSLRPGA